jgi:hypothetical protein
MGAYFLDCSDSLKSERETEREREGGVAPFSGLPDRIN